MDFAAENIKEEKCFFVGEALAEFEPSKNYFALKKVPVDAEIKIDLLPDYAKKLFTGSGGSRGKEWAESSRENETTATKH